MPKKIEANTICQCSVCGRIFSSEKKALRCEKSKPKRCSIYKENSGKIKNWKNGDIVICEIDPGDCCRDGYYGTSENPPPGIRSVLGIIFGEEVSYHSIRPTIELFGETGKYSLAVFSDVMILSEKNGIARLRAFLDRYEEANKRADKKANNGE